MGRSPIDDFAPTDTQGAAAIDAWQAMDDERRQRFVNSVSSGQWKRWGRSSMGGAAMNLDEGGVMALVWLFRHNPASLDGADDVQPLERGAGPRRVVLGQENERADVPYLFHADLDEYMFERVNFQRGRFIASGADIRMLVELYSNDGAGMTINQVADRMATDGRPWSRKMVVEVLRLLGMTHDSLPFTNEEILDGDEGELADRVLQQKRMKVEQRVRRDRSRNMRKNAEKWERLELHARELLEHVSHRPPVTDMPELPMGDPGKPYTAVVGFTDFHYGMWGDDFSGYPYNREIARRRLKYVAEQIAQRLNVRGRPEKIVILDNGDTFHVDNAQKTTTRGTPQDMDGSVDRMIIEGTGALIDFARYLSSIAPVEYRKVPGNHDQKLSVAALVSLYHAFADDPRVDVKLDEALDGRGLLRQYMRLYDSLIGACHGNNKGPKDWASNMARECRKDWVEAQFHYVLSGHLHVERQFTPIERLGVQALKMPSLAGQDDYHYGEGYPCDPRLMVYLVREGDGIFTYESIRAGVDRERGAA